MTTDTKLQKGQKIKDNYGNIYTVIEDREDFVLAYCGCKRDIMHKTKVHLVK